MKRLCRLSSVVLLLIALAGVSFLLGCEGDAGPEGVAGTTVCLTCHDDSDSEGIVSRGAQWEHSKHAAGETTGRSSRGCEDCHTSEGFLETLGITAGTGLEGNIGCFTCHAPHTEGDFSVRTNSAVTFLDGTGTYNYGNSNLCANCHQSQGADPEIAAAPATTSIDDLRWGPHHGPQSNLLAGTGGFEFAGENYPDSYHTGGVSDGCIACHMAEPAYGMFAGGHNFGVSYEYHGSETDFVAGCEAAGCHSSMDDFDDHAAPDWDGDGDATEGPQEEIDGLLDNLRQELLTRNLIDADDYLVADEENPLVLTEAEAGAVWNFRFILEDRSHGIHNPDYAQALLQTALDNLP